MLNLRSYLIVGSKSKGKVLMEGDLEGEIERLKLEIEKAERAQLKRDSLLGNREELEEEANRIRGEIEEDTLDMYRKPEELEVLAKHVEEQHDLLEQTLQRKRDIDHLLDSWDNYTLDDRILLEKELIGVILSQHPDQRPTYEHIISTLKLTVEHRQQLLDVSRLCTQLIEALEVMIAARQTVKRRGLLSYLIGPNPNGIISQQMEKIEKFTEMTIFALEKHAQQGLHNKSVQKIQADLVIFLNSLHEHSKKRWGFGKIDTTFAKAFLELTALHAMLAEHICYASEAEDLLDKKLHVWMQTYTG
ncbi:MAG: hypothetical protein H0X51_09105 [Parachlamydiaceae bacterium]|nr:hypothetical protein [Parachlamydiaceae bacterium]